MLNIVYTASLKLEGKLVPYGRNVTLCGTLKRTDSPYYISLCCQLLMNVIIIWLNRVLLAF